MTALFEPRSTDSRFDYAAGWSHGFAAGVAAQPDRRWLVAHRVAWRHVRAYDAIRGDDGESVWTIVRAGWARPIDPPPGTDPGARIWSVVAQCGVERSAFTVNPDMMTDVLIEVAMVDAFVLTREQLGARLLASRVDPGSPADAPGTDGDLDWRVST